jgi:hypothetical protein
MEEARIRIAEDALSFFKPHSMLRPIASIFPLVPPEAFLDIIYIECRLQAGGRVDEPSPRGKVWVRESYLRRSSIITSKTWAMFSSTRSAGYLRPNSISEMKAGDRPPSFFAKIAEGHAFPLTLLSNVLAKGFHHCRGYNARWYVQRALSMSIFHRYE